MSREQPDQSLLPSESRTTRIAALNDSHRKGRHGVFLTASIAELPTSVVSALIGAVVAFNEFDSGNNPYGEHDFGAVTVLGEKYFWKIDYYDIRMECHSPDASDDMVTRRVLTVMRADEY
jgi:hypothetical protein